MSGAALDRLLALLVGAILLTGILTLRAGSADTWWLYALHGALSGVLLAATLIKLKRSLPRAWRARRWRELAVSLPMAVAALGALLIGFAWVAGGRYMEFGPWTVLGWHGMIGWVLVGLVAVHLITGPRWRVLRFRGPGRPASGARGRQFSRRTALATGALAVTGLLVWGVAGVLDLVSPRPRRFTGSRWLPDGGIPIPTTFFGEGAPAIGPTTWRLAVRGAVEKELALSIDDLRALGVIDQEAVLDCTGGWAMRTTWSGVPMTAVLEAVNASADATVVDVRSATGWGARLGLEEARGTMLALAVAGQELPVGNGAPCRLVVPDRRGLDWVKWVSEIVVA